MKILIEIDRQVFTDLETGPVAEYLVSMLERLNNIATARDRLFIIKGSDEVQHLKGQVNHAVNEYLNSGLALSD